jgi:hypothetical protein
LLKARRQSPKLFLRLPQLLFGFFAPGDVLAERFGGLLDGGQATLEGLFHPS